MENNFNLIQEDPHIVFTSKEGTTFLVDTGSPFSVSERNEFIFCGEKHSASDNIGGVSVSELNRYLKNKVDVLLGNDILSQYNMKISRRNNNLTLSLNELPGGNLSLDIENIMSIPVLTLEVDNKKGKYFFDTGAITSYINEENVNGLPAIKTEKDFYPMFGEFYTSIYELNLNIANDTHNIKFGVLPDLIGLTLPLAGVDGIIGVQLLEYYDVVLNNKSEKLSLIRI